MHLAHAARYPVSGAFSSRRAEIAHAFLADRVAFIKFLDTSVRKRA